ncbi:MAG: TrkH family potassium uptake protein [Bacteroidota bacterium]
MDSKKEINFKLIAKFNGLLLIILSGFMLISAIWSWQYEETEATKAILLSVGITLCTGLLMYILSYHHDHRNIGKKEGYIIVTLTWVSISIFGALPFYISGAIPSYTDAFFETISGFTTTGATILYEIESVSKGLLFWRSLTQWLGGMGIIVLTLAVLPILGVGGMQLFVAEAPGTTPNKIHPRIAQTAKRLWGIYIILTLIQTILLMLGNLSFFDSICHAFTTMATGGFSTYNDSITGFTPYTQYIIILFMIFAGVSFSLHYYILKGNFSKVLENEEFRFYILLILGITAVFTVSILIFEQAGFEKSFRDSLFQVVSILTTTGFNTVDYLAWQQYLWFILFLLMFTGGCIGSTGGGLKIIRVLILLKNSRLELKRLIHPMAIIPVRINKKTIPQEINQNFLAFFLIYIMLFVAGTLLMTIFDLDFASAAGASAATIGNIGPGIGSVGPLENYAHIPDAGKWILSFLMLIGRLELFTVLLLFSPSFWKK